MKLLCLVLFVTSLLCVGGRGGRRRGGGGFDGVDPSLLDPWSFLPDTSKLDMAARQRAMEVKVKAIKEHRKQTNYGTKFANTQNISQKVFGVGVGPGFVGGAGLGLWEPNYGYLAVLVSYSVYHRYIFFKRLLHQKGLLPQFDTVYYDEYYEKNICLGGCPANSQCVYGVCECNTLNGYHQMWGKCTKETDISPTKENFNPFLPCVNSSTCLATDKNLICSDKTSTCTCRKDTKWNVKLMECQLYIDVDCTAVTYSSAPSAAVLAALEINPARVYLQEWTRARDLVDMMVQRTLKAKEDPKELENLKRDKICKWPHGLDIPLDRVETKDENRCTNLLPYVESNKIEELTEAYCRDIDAFSVVFQFQEAKSNLPCPKIPIATCAVVYDSHDCSGGWNLTIRRGEQRRFRYFSSDWKYRNDIDTVGVRAGCTFVGFSGSSFDGSQFSLTAGLTDRWVVLGEHPKYHYMDQNIESLQCVCRG